MRFEVGEKVVCVSDTWLGNDGDWAWDRDMPLEKGKLYTVQYVFVPGQGLGGVLQAKEYALSVGVNCHPVAHFAFYLGSPLITADFWRTEYFRKVRKLETKTGLAQLINLTNKEVVHEEV